MTLRTVKVPFVRGFRVTTTSCILGASFITTFFFILVCTLGQGVMSSVFLVDLLRPTGRRRICHDLDSTRGATLIVKRRTSLGRIRADSRPCSRLFASHMSGRRAIAVISLTVTTLFLVPQPLVVVNVTLAVCPLIKRYIGVCRIIDGRALPTRVGKSEEETLVAGLLVVFTVTFVAILVKLFFGPVPSGGRVSEGRVGVRLVTPSELRKGCAIDGSVTKRVRMSDNVVGGIGSKAFRLLVANGSSPGICGLSFGSSGVVFISKRLNGKTVRCSGSLSGVGVMFGVGRRAA